jgi:uncharacterized membrane protein
MWVAVVVLASVSAHGATIYDQLPEVIATHWGPDGAPDEWSPTSFTSVYLPLLIGVAACGLMAGAAALVPAMTRTTPEQSEWEACRREGDRRVIIVILSTAALMTVALVSVATLQVWAQVQSFSAWPIFLCILAAIMIAVPTSRAVSSQVKQRASAAGVRPSSNEELEDSRWLPGSILNDPHDPQIMVPKREGTGYGLTVNVGHRKGRAVVAGFLVITLGLPLALLLIASQS